MEKIEYHNGIFIANNWLDDNTKKKNEDLVRKNIEHYPNINFRIYENDFYNSALNDKIFQDKIKEFCMEVIKQINIDVDVNKKYRVLRIINGKNDGKQSHLFHFDAHKLTILVPIIIPDNNNIKNGDLIIIPNVRKLHNNIFLNILQKFIFQNFLIRFLLKKKLLKKFLKQNVIKIKPGNLYAFIGFTTLHGNESIENFTVRASLLIHFDDVFKDSILVKLNRKISQFKENINKKKL